MGVALGGFVLAGVGLVGALVGLVIMLIGVAVMFAPILVGSVDDRSRYRRGARDTAQAKLPCGDFAKLELCSRPGALCDCPKWHRRW